MDQHALQAAAPAQRLAARIDRQPNQQTAVSLIRAVVNKETFPESGPRNSIHRDGIDRVEWVGLATSNLPFQLPSTASAPGFREEPFIYRHDAGRAAKLTVSIEIYRLAPLSANDLPAPDDPA
jgi:hypothetical protein